MKVYGVSFDTVEENAAFAEKFAFTFPLLSDTERELGLSYQACKSPEDQHAQRITYVIGPDGKIEHAIETSDPGAQAAEILMELQQSIARGGPGARSKKSS